VVTLLAAGLIAGLDPPDDAAVYVVAPGVAVTRRTTPGGAGPAAVAAQLARFEGVLEVLRVRVAP